MGTALFETPVFQASRAPAPHDGADYSRVKQGVVNKDEPRMNTNRHEYEWISFGFSSWPIGNQDPVPLIRLSTN